MSIYLPSLTHKIADTISGLRANWEDYIAHKEQHGFRGALLRLTADKSIPSGVRTVIDWDSPVYDTSNFWSADNPSRLTVPIGVSKVRLTTFICWQNNNNGERSINIYKNGNPTWFGRAADRRAASGNSETTISTAVVEVAAGDYFEVAVMQTSGVALSVLHEAGTSFSIEVIE